MSITDELAAALRGCMECRVQSNDTIDAARAALARYDRELADEQESQRRRDECIGRELPANFMDRI